MKRFVILCTLLVALFLVPVVASGEAFVATPHGYFPPAQCAVGLIASNPNNPDGTACDLNPQAGGPPPYFTFGGVSGQWFHNAQFDFSGVCTAQSPRFVIITSDGVGHFAPCTSVRRTTSVRDASLQTATFDSYASESFNPPFTSNYIIGAAALETAVGSLRIANIFVNGFYMTLPVS